MALIEYRDLAKSYGPYPALRGINLDIGSGRIVGLLGPNGSGKTTLIKLTTGLLSPTQGTIRVNGNPVGIDSKADISYLPERTYLNGWMTVEDILDFFRDFYRDFDRVKALDMLMRLDIDPKRRLRTLSKGTKEKVQLVLVMSRSAKIYILDEPIAGVDPAARDYILRTILTNYSENSTVIISTHLISDIEKVLDDVIFIAGGTITMAAPVDELRQREGKSIDQIFREVFRC